MGFLNIYIYTSLVKSRFPRCTGYPNLLQGNLLSGTYFRKKKWSRGATHAHSTGTQSAKSDFNFLEKTRAPGTPFWRQFLAAIPLLFSMNVEGKQLQNGVLGLQGRESSMPSTFLKHETSTSSRIRPLGSPEHHSGAIFSPRKNCTGTSTTVRANCC